MIHLSDKVEVYVPEMYMTLKGVFIGTCKALDGQILCGVKYITMGRKNICWFPIDNVKSLQ